MKFLEIGAIAILVIVIGCWLVNVYKLTQCDFVLPLKCEIIHGL